MEIAINREDGSRMILIPHEDTHLIGMYVENEKREGRTALTALTVQEGKDLKEALDDAIFMAQ